MGILTVLTGLILIALGLGSVVLRRPLLPELVPSEVAMATVPFGVIIALLGFVLF